MSNEEKLQKAERDYTAGTEFISVDSGREITSSGKLYYDEEDERIYAGELDPESGSTYPVWTVYYNGQWAEIVFKPERERGITITHAKETPQPLDIESDPRYNELLDEEAKRNKINNFKEWQDQLNPHSTDIYKWLCLSIIRNTEKAYFSELLAEKDKLILNAGKGLEELAKNCTATIAEKTKDSDLMIASYRDSLRDSKATIEQQKKEIEQLKQELKGKL